VIYGSLVAWAQKDVKKLIAYSSVAHLGFVVLGITMWNVTAIDGAVYQMLAHGISTGGLFLCVGVLYERRHTRRIDEFGGVMAVMPVFGAIFLVITLASIGVPGLSGFVGEFLILLGTFTAYDAWGSLPIFPHPKPLGAVAALGVILGAVYMLYLFQKVMFGPLSNPRNRELKDLSWRERVVFLPVLLMAFWLGLHPSTFLSDIDPAVTRTVAAFKTKYTAVDEGTVPRLLPRPGEASPSDQAPEKTDKAEQPPSPSEHPAGAEPPSPPAEGAVPR
jgi:NADH-quinone oxidoreductase subunit M